MIQRIQSVYLLAAAIFGVLFYMFPIAFFEGSNGGVNLYSCHLSNVNSASSLPTLLPLAILPVISVFLSVMAIFLFNKRVLQMKLAKLNMLVLFIIILLSGFYFVNIGNVLNTSGKPAFAAIFPVLAIILVFMANRAIKKDHDLIKSADRIR